MNRNKTIAEVLCQGKALLQKAGKENASFECALLLGEILQKSRLQLLTEGDGFVTAEEEIVFFHGIEERMHHRPLQYILGSCEFMGLPFSVGEGVLIPRGDTEILVETVLEVAKAEGLRTVVDMGTGSGCIPISLAYYGKMQAIGLDISRKALAFAEENGKKNNVEVEFLESHLFSALPDEKRGGLDAIVSNPPYIAGNVIPTLMPEVREFEPRNALDGGVDGLDFYRRIVKESPLWLRDGGWLFLEIGYDQGEALLVLLQENGFLDCCLKQDLSGLDRVVFGRFKKR